MLSIGKINCLHLIVLAVSIAVCGTGFADTFHLHSGVPIHGTVLHTDGTYYHVRTGNRTMRIPKGSVALREENDKDGSINIEAARQAAAERERQLYEETGLTREQRDQIRELYGELDNADPLISGKARRTLTELAQDPKVFLYIENLLPSILPFYVPNLLQVLFDSDQSRAVPLLRAHATHADVYVRATAVELLGVACDTGALSLMMRGLLDHETLVRMAACSALASMGAEEATPLLLDNFTHADLRVQNYAREALRVIWGKKHGADKLDPDAFDEWEAFWVKHSPEVKRTVDIEALEPLVDPDARVDFC